MFQPTLPDSVDTDLRGSFGCAECGRTFKRPSSLRKHVLYCSAAENNSASASASSVKPSYSIEELLSPNKTESNNNNSNNNGNLYGSRLSELILQQQQKAPYLPQLLSMVVSTVR